MLVFIDNGMGRKLLAGNCDLQPPPGSPGKYEGIHYLSAEGLRQVALTVLGFNKRQGPPLDVIVLDREDDPHLLPGFREVDGRA